MIEGSSLTNGSIEDNGIMSNTDEEEEYEDHNVTSSDDNTSRPRERRTSHIMEKIKMVLFEKRKSVSTTYGNNKNRRSSSNKTRQRPLSYSDVPVGDNEAVIGTQQGSSRNNSTVNSDSSAVPLSQSLSRQSTTHLTEIDEEAVVINSYNSNSRERNPCIQQAMAVDV